MTCDISRAADRLEEARSTLIRLRPLSQETGGLTEEEAWAIAAEVDRRRQSRGGKRAGYKLGWTSAAMREALGVEKANFGSLWEGMNVERSLNVEMLGHPKAEPEFAFRASQPLRGREVTADQVIDSGQWAVALEVVDPRWESYSFTWEDNTADGSSAAAYVCGPFVDTDVCPEQFALTMSFNGGEDRQGTGEAALGSPAEAVAYLVQKLHARGEYLDEGMVVLTGGVTSPVDLVRGAYVHVSSPHLGECELHCSG